MTQINIPGSDIPIGFGLVFHVYPCMTTPAIIVQAAETAALKAAIGFFQPTWKQEIKKVTGGSWLHNIKEYMAADQIEDAAFFDAELTSFFEVAELVDKLAWYLFLFSSTVEFLIDWATTTYEMSGCLPKPSDTIGNSTSPVSVYQRNGAWQDNCAFVHVTWNNAPESEAGSTFGCNAGEVCTCVVVQEWNDLGGVPINTQSRVVNNATGKQISYSFSNQGLFDGTQSTINECRTNVGGETGFAATIQGLSGEAGETDDAWADSGRYYYERTTFAPS